MKLQISSTALALALCMPIGDVHAASTDPVPVYDATQVAMARYTVIKRLWVESWRSAFWIPGYRDAGGARQALLAEAARLGADAVVNLVCMDKTDNLFRPTGFYCYGSAVKVKR
jgi:hypothetical protein